MKNTVVILRGPSGSGKSTWIKKNYPGGECRVCSADHFFEDPQTLEYKFDVYKLAQAHAQCLANFITACRSDIDYVIVDNTNTHYWEWKNYEAVAKQIGRFIKVVEFRVTTIEQLKLCQRRNIRGVDPATVAKMVYEFEPSSPPAEIVDVK